MTRLALTLCALFCGWLLGVRLCWVPAVAPPPSHLVVLCGLPVCPPSRRTTHQMLTVGFGDLVPTRPVSKAFTILFILVSILLATAALAHLVGTLVDRQEEVVLAHLFAQRGDGGGGGGDAVASSAAVPPPRAAWHAAHPLRAFC